MNKISFFTTLTKLKKANACEDGLKTLIASLPKNHKEFTRINLLHILKSNGLKHFFWAWRATTTPDKIKRLIIHDLVVLLKPISLRTYSLRKDSHSTAIKDVLEALKSGNNRQLKIAADKVELILDKLVVVDNFVASGTPAKPSVIATLVIADVAHAVANGNYATAAVHISATVQADLNLENKQIRIIKKYLK